MPTEAPTLYPSLRYRDAPAAIDFLKRAFGFRERVVYSNPDGTIAHAELTYGPSILMLGTDKDDQHGVRAGLGWLYLSVDDADAHCARARAAGAEILKEPFDTEYGSRDYAARDPEGNMWNVGTYRPAADQVDLSEDTAASAAAH
jgi:uncharacterized glyoxalase superfamily protein PhnB